MSSSRLTLLPYEADKSNKPAMLQAYLFGDVLFTRHDQKQVIKGKLTTLSQSWAIIDAIRQGHGIDLICKVAPYPPPPKWITIESKTMMKESFGPHATPRAGKVSDYQKDPIGNLSKHIDLAERSLRSKVNEYSINQSIRKEMTELIQDIKRNSRRKKDEDSIVKGYKLTIGIDDKFNVSSNLKYKQLYIFEELTK